MANSSPPTPEMPLTIFVGQHESHRSGPVTEKLLAQAQSVGYDSLTAPITTPHFQSRVLSQLEHHVKALQQAACPEAVPSPTISPLMPEDSDFTPSDINDSLVALVSPWIDLGSPDPLIASISRQVFTFEVAYAAFCGVSNVLINGPSEGADEIQYSRAIREALALGSYVQLQVVMPMSGELELEGAVTGNLSELVRAQYAPRFDLPAEDEEDANAYHSWDVWNIVRTMCNYSNKLTVGKMSFYVLPPYSQSPWCTPFPSPVQ